MKSKSTIQRTLRAVLSGTAVLAGVIIATAPANATSISILNGNFEAVPVPDWYWVPDWDEGGASYVQAAPGLGSGRCLYLDGPGGWVSQNLSYNWTAGEVFTLGIKGNQGWRAGGTFKIQLREADGTVLWDSGTTSVNSTTQNFSWSIDASTFSGAGVTPGSQLNLRIDCLANTTYLDDVTLSSSLADTTPPTLASASIVDNKSGGPVNPGQVVTYTVTFSEGMDSGTVSASDFESGGTAAVLIGTPTTLDGLVYKIPVVASGTGTLQLRVPVGTVMTDLTGNPLDTSSAILDDTTINVEAKPIGVTGGDFQVPYTNGQPGDIPLWFDSTYQYADWHNAALYSANASQTALINYNGSNHGYIYQSLGQLVAGTNRLDWSFDQVKGNGTAVLRFFYGVSLGVGEGVDIDTLGFTQIGSTVSFPGTSDNVMSRSGSVDVSALPAGATIWMDFTNTAPGNDMGFLLDNISGTGATGALEPEIALEQPAGTDIPNGGAQSFGTVTLGSNTSLEFTIRNTGTADLTLSGTPLVDITGANASDFAVTSPPLTPVTADGGTTTFTVQCAPGAAGVRNATLSIANNDPTGGENSFVINLSGTGESLQTPYEAWSGGNGFNTLNGEGIAYGMAWLLGAPTNSSPSIGLLPKARHEAGKLVVEFTCLKVAKRGTAVLKLQSSKDLGLTDLWTDHEVEVPDTAGPVGPVTFSVPTTNANPDLVDLKAEIPSSEATLFGRLKGSETP